jgi:hypothetical protein
MCRFVEETYRGEYVDPKAARRTLQRDSSAASWIADSPARTPTGRFAEVVGDHCAFDERRCDHRRILESAERTRAECMRRTLLGKEIGQITHARCKRWADSMPLPPSFPGPSHLMRIRSASSSLLTRAKRLPVLSCVQARSMTKPFHGPNRSGSQAARLAPRLPLSDEQSLCRHTTGAVHGRSRPHMTSVGLAE